MFCKENCQSTNHQIIQRVNDGVVDGPPVHDAVHYLGVLQEGTRQKLLEVNLTEKKR